MKKTSTFLLIALFIFNTGMHSVQASNFFGLFEKEKIKILIVPGHDADYGGAVYNNILEADMTLVLAEKIGTLLNTNPLFSATVARTADGYISALAEYFQDSEAIGEFITEHKEKTNAAVEGGDIDLLSGVVHNDAPSLVATRLYGINKWADEENYDMVIHVHFNDTYPRTTATEDDVTGFTVYVPGSNLPNHATSLALGTSIGERLVDDFFVTNAPSEQPYVGAAGTVADEKLIAVGANGTISIPSVLVEYAYIYEPMVQGDYFSLTTDVMAHATTQGVFEYVVGVPLMNKNLGYTWNTALKKTSGEKNIDVLALQFALHELGIYPPLPGRTTCTFDGMFGPCTDTAVKTFQKKYGLDADGLVGAQSRTILHILFPEY